MRLMLKFTIPADKGNQAAKDGIHRVGLVEEIHQLLRLVVERTSNKHLTARCLLQSNTAGGLPHQRGVELPSFPAVCMLCSERADPSYLVPLPDNLVVLEQPVIRPNEDSEEPLGKVRGVNSAQTLRLRLVAPRTWSGINESHDDSLVALQEDVHNRG